MTRGKPLRLISSEWKCLKPVKCLITCEMLCTRATSGSRKDKLYPRLLR